MVNKLRKKPRNAQNNYTKADYIAKYPYLFPEALREVRFPKRKGWGYFAAASFGSEMLQTNPPRVSPRK